jgi:hypothetical protein
MWSTSEHLSMKMQIPHHQQFTTNRLASKLHWSHLDKIVAAAIRRRCPPPLPSRDLDFKTWSCPSVEVLKPRSAPGRTDTRTDTILALIYKISIQMNYEWENFKFKNISNVWKPHFKSFPLNQYMWQNKTFTKQSSNTWKTLLHKLEILVETCNNGKYLCLAHLKLEAFNNLKTFFSSNLKLQHWNFQQFEKTPFHTLFQTSMFKLSTNWRNFLPHTWNLNIQKTLFHTWKFITFLKKSLPHLPFTSKCCKLFACHHLEKRTSTNFTN